MILIFHLLNILILKIIRLKSKLKIVEKDRNQLNFPEVTNNLAQVAKETEDVENDLKFDPPVYRQRYARIYEILLDEKWRKSIKKLVDFGCAEFNLFVFIKRLTSLTNILFVDIDEDLLKHYVTKIQPLTIEYLKRRSEPLLVSVLAGSVADPDYRLLKTDAVIAIELIEHLYPDVLDAFSYNIFSFIEPKIAIITTPNSDFNVLFRNFKKFRHWDHKFEWSRKQFEDWGTNIISRFPDYTVEFSGVGEGPAGSENLGCCSQMAVFLRRDVTTPDYISAKYSKPCVCNSTTPCKEKTLCSCVCAICSPDKSVGVCTLHSYSKKGLSCETGDNCKGNTDYNICYKTVDEIEFPYDNDERSEEEKMIDEFRYRINSLGQFNGRFYNQDENRAEIPLRDLLYGADSCCILPSELDKLLRKSGYTTKECVLPEAGISELCVLYEPEMEKYSSESEASGYDSDYTKYKANDEESVSDWDEPYIKEPSGKKPDTYGSSNKEANTSETNSPHAQNDIDITPDPEEDKKQQESLFDSGYQKSSSILDDSPQTPLEDLDVFEDTTSQVTINSTEANNKLPSKAPDKIKIDVDKINELDGFANQNQHYHFPTTKAFIGPMCKQQVEGLRKSHVKDAKEALPGPSNIKKRRKLKKTVSSDSEDDTSLEDVMSIANCLLENTLNKIDVGDEENHVEFIGELRLEAEALEEAEENEAALLVENGDLANNNRDLEGNNYIAFEEDLREHDLVNDNVEVVDEVLVDEGNNANFDNNNEGNIAEALPLVMVAQVEEAPVRLVEEVGVAQASREALFDPNSQVDLLDDFEIPEPVVEVVAEARPVEGNNYFLVGVHYSPDDPEADNPEGFPHWLLQILGAHISTGENAESHDEPHFYCQGDGLGVHPSIIAVDVEDEDDASSESSEDSVGLTEQHGNSEPDIVSSLSEDVQSGGAASQVTDQVGLRPTGSETEEFFDTVTGGSTSESSLKRPNSQADF